MEGFALLIKTGRIVDVENHPDADKLYILSVDLGDEERQLVAGLRGIYEINELKGKKVAVLCNLKHAKIRGVVSEGMVLAADDGSTITLITSDADLGSVALPEGMDESVVETLPEQISFEKFTKHKLTVKNGCVTWNGKKLLADGHELKPEKNVKDGAVVR